ncbi:MAG TPA: GGDEF domain-containing protein [Candidatus Nitrosotenuis sp.]|nr:GGDEF domain-containing protein [Candidatus Nitrosotenuis sp.]
MGRKSRLQSFLRGPLFWAIGICAFVAASFWLRREPYAANPFFFPYLEIVSSVMAFTFAASALVRFRGANDRIALMLSFGFVLAGLTDTYFGFSFYRQLNESPGTPLSVPWIWVVGHTFLAILFAIVLSVEPLLLPPRKPGREILSSLGIVAAVAYVTLLFYAGAGLLNMPIVDEPRSGALWARPWHLVPAAAFFLAAVAQRRRLKIKHTAFDQAIYACAALNVFNHLFAAQALLPIDAVFAVSQSLEAASYAVILGGALVDNIRLFDQVRKLASSDGLTGLANYRRFLDVFDTEMRRSQRTSRPFAVLLFDLDGLKKINDTYGHNTGSRAICRLAEVLRSESRVMDTAARLGGDEFALILPETDSAAAEHVAQRIRERLAADTESPAISASVGVAIYPRHGGTLEVLQSFADREMYAMKRAARRKRRHARSTNAA